MSITFALVGIKSENSFHFSRNAYGSEYFHTSVSSQFFGNFRQFMIGLVSFRKFSNAGVMMPFLQTKQPPEK